MKIFLIIFMFVQISCSTIGELALNTAAGALGNMLDRRVDDKSGNDAGLYDEILGGKLIQKEKDSICKDCEVDR
jgi:hypothetical protein